MPKCPRSRLNSFTEAVCTTGKALKRSLSCFGASIISASDMDGLSAGGRIHTRAQPQNLTDEDAKLAVPPRAPQSSNLLLNYASNGGTPSASKLFG